MSQEQPNLAESYERYIVPSLALPWAHELLDRMHLQPGERVLDVGCGTGIVARLAAPRVGPQGRIVGIDPSPAMLAVAQKQVSDGAQIEWHEANAESLPFPDESFDLVLCQQVLQFVPDKPAAVGEMHRVLRPGGRVGVTTSRELEHNPLYQALAEVVERHLGVPAMHTPFSLGNADHLHSLFTSAGFRDVKVDAVTKIARFPDPDRWVAIAAAPAMRDMDTADRARLTEAIRREMEAPLREFTEGNELVGPMRGQIVSAGR